jgi:thiosulfate/3-mercaptopyruvate sulfurtransferase
MLPTKLTTGSERKLGDQLHGQPSVKISSDTVIVDARSKFDYSTAHIPNSVSLWWSDFTAPDPLHPGVLQDDLDQLARRLARVGIQPSTHVVVVGNGLMGEGEEGRVAWMLAYLGVINVQFSSLDSLHARVTNNVDERPPKSVPLWKPEPFADLRVNTDDLLKTNAALDPRIDSAGASPVRILEVDGVATVATTAHEVMPSDDLKKKLHSIKIDWKDFFDEAMRPRDAIREKLNKFGITPMTSIIVTSRQGVSSGAVTMALRSLGYSHTSNLDGR